MVLLPWLFLVSLLLIYCFDASQVDQYDFSMTTAPIAGWITITCNSSGQFLAAALNNGSIFISHDYGNTWVVTNAPVAIWSGITSDSTGQYLVTTINGGDIYTSNDSGINWYPTSAPSLSWHGICSSSNGRNLVAIVYNGGIYTSSDYGQNWTATSAPSDAWLSIACDSTGQYLAAVVFNDGVIYTSNDYGTTWIQASAPSQSWYSIASSSSGQHLVAVVFFNGIYISNNYGNTWIQTSAPVNFWSSVSSDSTGQYLAATVQTGGIYTSSDFGATWVQSNAPTSDWVGIVSDNLGQRLAAVVFDGGIYVGDRITAPTSQPSSRPSLQPNSRPTSVPSLQPSSQPSSYPSYVTSNYDETTTVTAVNNNLASYTFTNIGFDSQVSNALYLTVQLQFSYLDKDSGAYLNVTVGEQSIIQTTTYFNVTNNECAPVTACSSSSSLYCAINVDVSNALSPSFGGSLIVHSQLNTASVIGGSSSKCNYLSSTDVTYVVTYSLSGNPQPTFPPTSAPASTTDSSNSGLHGLITADGASFYVIALVSVCVAFIGVALAKQAELSNGKLLPRKVVECVLDFALLGYYLVSEVVYLIVLLSSANESILLDLGLMLLLCRVAASVFPCYIAYQVLGPPPHALRASMDLVLFVQGGKLYGLLLFLMAFDATLVKYLPWKLHTTIDMENPAVATELAEGKAAVERIGDDQSSISHNSNGSSSSARSLKRRKLNIYLQLSRGFPNSQLYLLALTLKIFLLSVTLIVQAVVLWEFNLSNDFSPSAVILALLLLHLIASVATFLFASVTAFMQWRASSLVGNRENTNNNHDDDNGSMMRRSSFNPLHYFMTTRPSVVMGGLNEMVSIRDNTTSQLASLRQEIDNLRSAFTQQLQAQHQVVQEQQRVIEEQWQSIASLQSSVVEHKASIEELQRIVQSSR